MSKYNFGSGALFGTRSDIATQTPVEFGTLQDVSIDFSFDKKELYGNFQFPVAIGRGKGKVTGKAKLARVGGLAFASLFFGLPLSSGMVRTAYLEGPTAIPATPFQITVANGAQFVTDLGVKNAATGVPLKKVASAPIAGQYSVSAGGVYLFASADNVSGISVVISYTYTVAASGSSIAISNQVLGVSPTFSAVFYDGNFGGTQMNLVLNACMADKLQLPTKLDDFAVYEFDFSAFADAANNIGNWYFPEVN